MGTVGSGEVVKLFPLGKFGVQVYITCVAEKLVELLLIRSVGSFDFAVKLRRAGLDVGMADAFVFDMPMEFRLELMAIARSEQDAGRGYGRLRSLKIA